MSIESGKISSGTGSTPSTQMVSSTHAVRNSNGVSEGQIIRGQITDVRSDRIAIELDDGTKFTGQLSDASRFTIGQRATFQITTLAGKTVYMKALSESQAFMEDSTIFKAIDEANLPRTDKNYEVVKQLLDNELSISKPSIQQALQIAARFPNAGVDTLVTMMKYQIPFTEENVAQFEQFRNQNHQILGKMDAITNTLSDMLTSQATIAGVLGDAKNLNAFSNDLFQMILGNDAVLTPGSAMEFFQTTSQTPLDLNTLSSLTEDQRQDVVNTLKNTFGIELSEEMEQKIMDGSATHKELLSLLPEDTLLQSLNQTGDAENILQTVYKQYQIEGNPDTISSLLNPSAREVLLNTLSSLPLSDSFKEQFLLGTVNTKTFLDAFQKLLPELPAKELSAIFQKSEFQALIKSTALSKWCLPQNDLYVKDRIDRFYPELEQQMQQLEQLSKTYAKGSTSNDTLLSQTTDVKQGIEFMKTLNDMFSYIQLPIQLENKNIHADIYVFTKKEAMRKNPKNLRVLLHLDMDYLGSTDIHITLNGTHIETKFYFSHEDSKHLIEQNTELLGNALNEKGYSFSSEVFMSDKKLDVTKEILSQETTYAGMKTQPTVKRYSFDIRA